MRQRRRGPSESEGTGHLPPEVLADPVATARAILRVLPDAVLQAEEAGLSLIAQHLAKALHLARRIVASGDDGA